MRWRQRSKHPKSLLIGPSQASSLPWRTVGPAGHSAPENHDLTWPDRAEDVAIPSTHMAEQPVRRVLDAREAFPVKHEVLRATYADSARETWHAIGESVNLAADRIEVSLSVVVSSTNDPIQRRYKIRCPMSAFMCQTVRSETRMEPTGQGLRKCQDASTYVATLRRAGSRYALHFLFVSHDGKAARAYNQRRRHDLACDALTGRHFRPLLTGFSWCRWSRRRPMAASA